MNKAIIIRPETTADQAAIHRLTDDAFAPMPFGDGTEAPAIDRMRAAGDLILSLVAIKEEEVIGHVAFSPARIGQMKGAWYGLGPISVRINCQRQGVGTSLVKAGLAELSNRGAAGVVLLGNPKVYGPMGFAANGRLIHGTLPPEIIQFFTFDGTEPTGVVTFAPPLQEDHG